MIWISLSLIETDWTVELFVAPISHDWQGTNSFNSLCGFERLRSWRFLKHGNLKSYENFRSIRTIKNFTSIESARSLYFLQSFWNIGGVYAFTSLSSFLLGQEIRFSSGILKGNGPVCDLQSYQNYPDLEQSLPFTFLIWHLGLPFGQL